jgi:hypothetical protein
VDRPPLDNPYYDHYRAVQMTQHGDDPIRLDEIKARHEAVLRWSFAIPNTAAIDKLVEMSPLIEIGCGTGYWGSLVRQRGGDIELFDHAPPGGPFKGSYGFKERYTEIKLGGVDMVMAYPNCTLFLCWPPYKSGMAADCLQYYKGNRFVYIGEEDGGCCAEERFFKLLAAGWHFAEEVDIPQWYGIHDHMVIFERNTDAPVRVET